MPRGRAIAAKGTVVARLPPLAKGGEPMRDWMDEHLPWWVLGVINWPKHRLISRAGRAAG